MSGIEEETVVTTVVTLLWLYHCGYVCIGVYECVRVVVLGILP